MPPCFPVWLFGGIVVRGVEVRASWRRQLGNQAFYFEYIDLQVTMRHRFGGKLRWEALCCRNCTLLRAGYLSVKNKERSLEPRGPPFHLSRQERPLGQWCAGKCVTASFPGEGGERKALNWRGCQFPWCKYSHHGHRPAKFLKMSKLILACWHKLALAQLWIEDPVLCY